MTSSSSSTNARSKLEDFPTAEFDALFGLDPSLSGGRGNRPSGRSLPLLLRNKRRRLEEEGSEAATGGDAAVPAAADAEDQAQQQAAQIPTVSDDDSAAAADGLLGSLVGANALAATTATASTSFSTPQLTTLLSRTHSALTQIQRQLHRGEELYHADTDARGNLYKGWDAILDARCEDVGAGEEDFLYGDNGHGPHSGGGGGHSGHSHSTGPSRRMPLDNRWFSGSCPTYPVGGAGGGGRGRRSVAGGMGAAAAAGGAAALRSPARSPARSAAASALPPRPATSASTSTTAAAATPATGSRTIGGAAGPPVLPTPPGPKVSVNISVKGQLTTPQQEAPAAIAAAVTSRQVGPAAVPEGLVPGASSSATTSAATSPLPPPPPKADAAAAPTSSDVDMEDATADAADATETTPAPAPAAGGRASSRKSTRKRTRG